MTTMIEPDTRGVDALSGQLDDNLLQPLIFQQLEQEMAQQFADAPWPQQLPEFDDAPWHELPTVADMEALWLTSAPIDSLISKLGHRAHGEGPDLAMFMARQWRMADMELTLKRAREAEGAEAGTGSDDDGAVAGAAGVVSAETRRGGGDLSGGPEDGVAVGKGGKARGKTNGGRASKVSDRRGPGKAAG
jgi:hypothetical protein